MYPSTFNEVNGIFVHQQVKKLRGQGCEVKVISPVPWTPFPINYISKKWKKYSEIPQKVIWEGIEVYYPRFLSFPKALFFASSGNRMYKGIKDTVAGIYEDFKFNIIHSHVALPDGYCGMLVAKEYKKPLIVTIHGQDFQHTIFRNKKCKVNIEKTINLSKKVIIVSDKLKKIGENFLKIDKEKITVIPNGINSEDIFIGKSILLEKYKERKIILSVSHLKRSKGIQLNLKAISKNIKNYNNLFYIIVGSGKEKRELEEYSKQLCIQNNVEFVGEIPHKKVMEYMSICDIFSLPSYNEGFGVVYLEAMVKGKPVIGVKGQGIDGIAEHRKNGMLVKPKDIDSLDKALTYLIENPQIAKKMGERARKIVLENYTWEKNAEKTLKIYEEALNSEK
jgi:glycosyltransferase involved in cell wall biosynthesis